MQKNRRNIRLNNLELKDWMIRILKYGIYAKAVELLCFKSALAELSTLYPEMDMKSYKNRAELNKIEKNYRNDGGQLHRTKTLAQGDDCCNFHVTKMKAGR